MSSKPWRLETNMNDVNIPENTLISYYRDKHGNPRGVLVAVKKDRHGNFNVGYAQCRKSDKFSKKMGLKIALGRSYYEHMDALDNMPHNLRKMLPAFIKRCEKYYQVFV